MYRSLPEDFRSDFADVFSTKVSPDQVNFARVLGVVLHLFVIFALFYSGISLPKVKFSVKPPLFSHCLIFCSFIIHFPQLPSLKIY